MTTKLRELRVLQINKYARRATVADLVAALEAEGGEIVEKRWPLSGIEIREPGRYLVYGPLLDSRDTGEKP